MFFCSDDEQLVDFVCLARSASLQLADKRTLLSEQIVWADSDFVFVHSNDDQTNVMQRCELPNSAVWLTLDFD